MRIKEFTKKMFYEAMSPYGDDLYAVGGFSSCEQETWGRYHTGLVSW